MKPVLFFTIICIFILLVCYNADLTEGLTVPCEDETTTKSDFLGGKCSIQPIPCSIPYANIKSNAKVEYIARWGPNDVCKPKWISDVENVGKALNPVNWFKKDAKKDKDEEMKNKAVEAPPPPGVPVPKSAACLAWQEADTKKMYAKACSDELAQARSIGGKTATEILTVDGLEGQNKKIGAAFCSVRKRINYINDRRQTDDTFDLSKIETIT